MQNNISGSIPPRMFAELPQLQYLYLNENSLTGGLPDLMIARRLTELYVFCSDLAYNFASGTSQTIT